MERAGAAARVPRRRGAGRPPPVPPRVPAVHGGGEHARRARPAPALRLRQPPAQGDGHRHRPAVRGRHQRHDRPPRRRRAALRAGPRAGPRAVGPRALHHDAHAAPEADEHPLVAPVRRPRPAGADRRPLRVGAQGRAVVRPGRAAGHAGPGRRPALPHEGGERGPARGPRHHRLPRPGRRVPVLAGRARQRAQAPVAGEQHPPVRGRAGGRAAALGRRRRLHPRAAGRLPAPGRRQERQHAHRRGRGRQALPHGVRAFAGPAGGDPPRGRRDRERGARHRHRVLHASATAATATAGIATPPTPTAPDPPPAGAAGPASRSTP